MIKPVHDRRDVTVIGNQLTKPMHDDDTPLEPEFEEPERPWTEAQWEQFMLENEKLMDRYEQVMKEHPDRKWTDPLDLYHKVHYDLDLGEDPEAATEQDEPQTQASEQPESAPEEPVSAEARVDDDDKDDFRAIPAYRLAYTFSLAVYDYLKKTESGREGLDPIRQQLALHGLRIAADIAGGHGLGYDEETLCGNIVKNRWALNHAQEAQRLLQQLIEREPNPELTALLGQLPPLIKVLEERIAELRTKVWWDK